MFEFGDEFAIESYRVPWLIYVQLLVMILLVIVLFFGFSIFALDRSDNISCNSASSSSQSHGKDDPLLNKTSTSHSSSKVEENQSIPRETETSKSKGIIGEEIQEGEESSANDIALFGLLGQGHHPCHYIGLAKQAILKCFGLGYISETSRNWKHRKED